eukprot:CAMPEP_0178847390 /NCGR_PEP_ID=MMETSP0746-20121128/18637_1 /TAXON_ID=913974 /ORGANISM="Nitzschia punctata, Strain CCMP561" /LENGTH=248 /DNA_ID=CAMNT_0020512033 /DNA_START=82 /DNA_END=825 /DNA_ORIENTATION=+
MKVALLLSLCAASSAFVAVPSRSALKTTSLNVASTPENLDSWSDKPLYVPQSTKPVAARKVSKWERMTMADTVIPPNFSLAAAVALLGPLIMWYHPMTMADTVIPPNFSLAAAVALLGPLIMWYHPMTMADTVIPPNFSLAAAVALLGPLIMWYHPCKYYYFPNVGREKFKSLSLDSSPFSHLTTFLSVILGLLLFPAYMADGSPSLIGIFGGGFHLLFATLLWVQTARVRCVFEKDGFEFYNVKGPR